MLFNRITRKILGILIERPKSQDTVFGIPEKNDIWFLLADPEFYGWDACYTEFEEINDKYQIVEPD